MMMSPVIFGLDPSCLWHSASTIDAKQHLLSLCSLLHHMLSPGLIPICNTTKSSLNISSPAICPPAGSCRRPSFFTEARQYCS